MILEGAQSVIDAIREKKRLMDAGESHEHIKPLLIIDGGLMKGTYGAGAVEALEELGYTDVFTNAVGISSGAPTVAYFLSGEIRSKFKRSFEEFCSRKIINVWRLWNQVDTRYFDDIFQGKTGKGITVDTVLSSPTRLSIGVSDFSTGHPVLLHPQNGDELFRAVHASILMPNVSTNMVTFNDIRYVDGGFTRPHILQKSIEEIEATHVLVITNQDKTMTNIPLLERFLNNTLYRWRMPKALRFAAHERRKERMKAISYMKEHYDIPYALVWGDHSISSTERDVTIVRSVVEKSRNWWHALLTR